MPRMCEDDSLSFTFFKKSRTLNVESVIGIGCGGVTSFERESADVLPITGSFFVSTLYALNFVYFTLPILYKTFCFLMVNLIAYT